jgi:hypothetical protein
MKKLSIYIIFAVIFALSVFVKLEYFSGLPLLGKHNNDSHKPTLKIKTINHSKVALKLIQDALQGDYELVLSDKDYDIILDGVSYKKIGQSFIRDKAIKISYVWEAVKPELDIYDLSIGFDFIDDPKYIRIPLPYISYPDQMTNAFERGECNPRKKYFACFLVSNGGSDLHPLNKAPMDGCVARTRMFHKLSLYKRVESGGAYLNNIGGPIPIDAIYTTEDATAKWISQCKFMIAYENQSYSGYITEKPFKAYFSGAIPIYHADQSVLQDINKKAIIYDGDFASEDDVVEYIKKVDNDDKLYCDIWNQPILINPEKNYDVIKAQLRDKLIEVIQAKLNKAGTR